MPYFIGVDVGTGSARAGLVNSAGKVLKVHSKEIKIWNYENHFYEQSSDDIWNASKTCIKEILKGIDSSEVKGIGFDATCSLVAVDKDGQCVSLSQSRNQAQNVIMWLDHRADKEAAQITENQHEILRFTGRKISLEMQTPKLMWLKRNLREQYEIAGYFFDLPDFLTWKATNCYSRSLCSLVCKWTYEICGADKSRRWNPSYFASIGLEDLLADDAIKIGAAVKCPGQAVGDGLSLQVAQELGLPVGLPVATSLIDAHAGGLGMIGCQAEGVSSELSSKLSLICGTSTCHMAISKEPILAKGIWGPYFSAMVPEMWLNEAGQSVTGKLIDFIIETHPATSKIKPKIGKMHIQEYLSKLLQKISQERKESVDFLTKDLHMWPDFHGNRSPIADPTLKGMISGLTLSSDEENLALVYLCTVQALSYGTRQIMETLIKSGYEPFKSVLICGGLSKNSIFVQTQANAINLPVVAPNEPESVLLGSSILAACASGYFPDIKTAVDAMGGQGKVINPQRETLNYHEKKYKVFLKMLKDQEEYRKIML